MTHQMILHVLAIIFLTCSGIVLLIDLASELNWSQYYKWTLLWTSARYIGVVCGILLSLDTLF